MPNQNSNPRLLIIDYFDAVINQIDIKTETLLADQRSKEDERTKLNQIREKQIEKIKEIEQINLKYLPQNESIVTDNEFNSDLIKVDCVLMEEPKLINGLNLWITSWCYNQKNLEFLK